MFVFVTAPLADRAFVQQCVHDRLRLHGMVPTSRWAARVSDLVDTLPTNQAKLARDNDADLRGSDVCLVLARHGAGGEMFAQARVALEWGKAVVWCGRRHIMSSYRAGVVRTEDFEGALSALVAMKHAHVEGMRGVLLAHAGSPS